VGYFLLTMGSELQSIAVAGTLFFLGLMSPGPNFLVVIESTLRGLATDLSNPKTILFFGSIFAVTLRLETPAWTKMII
jgi:threonine/homoserine/homoserine lactone efflux protein